MSNINFIRGSSEDFSKLHTGRSSEADIAIISQSSYLPYCQPTPCEMPPIAKIVNLDKRLHVPSLISGDILTCDDDKETVVIKEENNDPTINKSVFDLGTSSLQRIITQMREMRRSSTKYTYKPTNSLNVVHKTPSCLPSYHDYLQGIENTNWEVEKRRHLAAMLAKIHSQ